MPRIKRPLLLATFALLLIVSIACANLPIATGTEDTHPASKAARNIIRNYRYNPALYQHHFHHQPISVHGRITGVPTATMVDIGNFWTIEPYTIRCAGLSSRHVATLRHNAKVTAHGIIKYQRLPQVVHIERCQLDAAP